MGFFHVYTRLLIDFENLNKLLLSLFHRNVALAFVYFPCLLESVRNYKLRKLFFGNDNFSEICGNLK